MPVLYLTGTMKKVLVFFTLLVLILASVIVFRKDNCIAYEDAVAKYQTEYSHFLDWKGVKLHYVDRGEGETVMLLHGYAGSFTNWNKLVDEFPEGYRLIIPDLPGLGLSQFPEIADDEDFIELYCDFTHTLIEELDLDSIHIVGNSLGGFLAWETTLRNEDKIADLVLLNAAGYSVDDLNAFFIKLTRTKAFTFIAKKGIPKFMAASAAKRCMGDPSKVDRSRVDAFHDLVNKEGNLEVVARLGNSGQVPDSTRISNISVPTLIVWGDKDAIVPVAHAYKFNRDIKNSKLLIYEGSGHVPMIENTTRLMKDLEVFWDTPQLTTHNQ